MTTTHTVEPRNNANQGTKECRVKDRALLLQLMEGKKILDKRDHNFLSITYRFLLLFNPLKWGVTN